jgi:hypothetical protein
MIIISKDIRLDVERLRDVVGFIPTFLRDDDPRTAREQFNANYISGWRSVTGFKRNGTTLTYPGDPPLKPYCVILFHDEEIYVYPHAWVMVVQKDGTFEICRMD